MKTNTIAKRYSSLKKKSQQFKTQFLQPKIGGVIKRMEMLIGIQLVKRELIDLKPYTSQLLQRIGRNYQHQQKKSNFVCVYSSANAYNLTHNEISDNIEKHQKLSEARWNDQLIEYICNH